MEMKMMLCLASDATGVRVLGGCVNYGTASIVAVLPWLLRRKCVGEGVGTRGWMPPRQLVAVVPRGSRGVVGEGVGGV